MEKDEYLTGCVSTFGVCVGYIYIPHASDELLWCVWNYIPFMLSSVLACMKYILNTVLAVNLYSVYGKYAYTIHAVNCFGVYGLMYMSHACYQLALHVCVE